MCACGNCCYLSNRNVTVLPDAAPVLDEALNIPPPLIPGPRREFAALLARVDLLLVQLKKVEQLRSAGGAQQILAVRGRDQELLAVMPAERDAIQIDTFHRFNALMLADRRYGFS